MKTLLRILRVVGIAIVGTALVVIGLAAAGYLGGDQKEPGPYRSEKHNFTIVPPKSWEQKSYPTTDVVFLCPKGQHSKAFRENLNVQVETRPVETSLDDYTQMLSKQLASKFPDYREMSLTDIEMSNIKGKRLVCTYSVGEQQKVHGVYYFAVKGKTAYLISCAAHPESFAKVEKTFDECARTFRVE